jgi:hypothetical protein
LARLRDQLPHDVVVEADLLQATTKAISGKANWDGHARELAKAGRANGRVLEQRGFRSPPTALPVMERRQQIAGRPDGSGTLLPGHGQLALRFLDHVSLSDVGQVVNHPGADRIPLVRVDGGPHRPHIALAAEELTSVSSQSVKEVPVGHSGRPG